MAGLLRDEGGLGVSVPSMVPGASDISRAALAGGRPRPVRTVENRVAVNVLPGAQIPGAAVARVVAALPAEGVALSHLAACVLGDAHALDDDRSAATLVLGAARVLGGMPEGSGAAWRRGVWASVGVLKDELSSTVPVLNLPGAPATATGPALSALAGAGQPAVPTLRRLVAEPGSVRWAGERVSVCENPAVVAAAADRWGAACAPLVCLQGEPSAAALTLLRGAADGGAALRSHADFDPGGVRIAPPSPAGSRGSRGGSPPPPTRPPWSRVPGGPRAVLRVRRPGTRPWRRR